MTLVAWSDKYSVGVDAADSQHFVLFEILNDLHAAMMRGEGQAVTGPLLAALLKHTRDHFSGEEAMMAAAGYPGLEAHKALHRELTGKVEEYIQRHERGERMGNAKFLAFLRDWLIDHIQTADRNYGPWLNEHGIV
jgi:hemerythrin-like metal-binding protein